MMVSGDLIAHSFPCRFKTLLPGATQGEYQAFVLKTLSFVAQELRDSLPEKPVYVALGNNDSGCDDYRLDAGSEFLAEASKAISKGLPAGQRQNTIHQFAEGGYYSLAMGAPMRDTRLIVINDVFLSPSYTTCGGAPQAAAGNAEMAWFKKQLEDARLAHERVWVMGHIPPGVDVYSTMRKMLNICGMAKPETFLLTDKMANLMVEYADVIQLGIFAHTHMDEMQLLKSADSGAPVSSRQGVAIKRVPSISPVNGNQPSFTLARVNATTAMLQDFEVIEASNQSGVGAAWSREYSYSETYGETEYSPASVTRLVAGFERDRDAHGKLTQAYLRDYLVGDRSAQLAPFWSIYACGLENWTDKAFANCVCSAGSSNTTGESAK
jgi:sphingomyelin phosphodiesterase acid-like 3